MTFEKLSKKQMKVLKWWNEKNIAENYDCIICDGAVRSGKTTVMIMSFVLWAMDSFNNCTFGVCGKTVRSAERNVIMPLQQIIDITSEYQLTYTRSINLLIVSKNERKNYFYVFGGKDESSYQLIQGITLSGVFFDEAALMPESFVNQAIARTLSVRNRRLWFNCNPENPNHWFYLNWITEDSLKNKNAVHLHFTMKDNPILTDEDISRAKKLYSGVFYDRYILGKWVVAEGLVYANFNKDIHTVPTIQRNYTRYQISVDYGTFNPFCALLWGNCGGIWYCVKEYWYSGRRSNNQRDDGQYYDDLCGFAAGLKIDRIIVDPSASSFITHARHRGKFTVIHAKNDVIDGIQSVQLALNKGLIKYNDCCVNTIKEYGLYSWKEKSSKDEPIKENDHGMDASRYFVFTNMIAIP